MNYNRLEKSIRISILKLQKESKEKSSPHFSRETCSEIKSYNKDRRMQNENRSLI